MTPEKKNRKKPSEQPQEFASLLGQTPPQAVDLEEAVLGQLMIERDAFDRISSLLRADMFYKHAHQIIYRAIARLSMSGQAVDILLVKQELEKTEELEIVGGAYYITRLTNQVVSAANIEAHGRIIYEKWFLREQIRIGGLLLGLASDPASDPFENMDELEKELQGLAMASTTSAVQHISSVMVERMRRLSELQNNQAHVIGIPSGFTVLDRITHGWQNTDLVILAARPAVGKTAFALNLARNASLQRMADGSTVGVLFFSLEMSAGQLVDRIMSMDSEVPLEDFKTGQMSRETMQLKIFGGSIRKLSGANFFIDDTAGLSMFQMRSKCRSVIRKHPHVTQWIIILDYLQLMSGQDTQRGARQGNREQEISSISRNLKILAKELNVPIIALSQLSREVEKRGSRDGSKVPQLSDLRESGAIEQDADMVMFLYRPEYYETGNELGESTKGLTELSIAKHRNGNLAQGKDAIKLRARLHIQKFEEWGSDLPAISAPSGYKVYQSSADRRDDDEGLPF